MSPLLPEGLIVDFEHERIGPFRMEDELQLPGNATDNEGRPIGDGDIVYIQPWDGITITLYVTRASEGLRGRVVGADATTQSGAILYGKPIAEISLTRLLSMLEAIGIRSSGYCEGGDVLYLCNGMSLGVFHDTIDVVVMSALTPYDVEIIGIGNKEQRLARIDELSKERHKTVNDPAWITGVVQVAIAGGK
jgi:hypothetical protein